jgi:hypothetical protein
MDPNDASRPAGAASNATSGQALATPTNGCFTIGRGQYVGWLTFGRWLLERFLNTRYLYHPAGSALK